MKKKLRILIAEDEYLVLMGLKADLEELGHEIVVEATDGESAVKNALEVKPDLIIIDINMPNMDGIEALKMINKNLIIPSIIITGYSDKELVERASKVGVFAYLVKPVERKELRATINVVMNRFEDLKKANDELDNTKKALEIRKYIEKAKGILMDTLDISEEEAMKKLQRKSQDKNIRIVDIAKEIIKINNLVE
ncbi:response regulator [Halocella sp. SP3-1]|uniref:ANTAR domain-containing response regulator n=1 Tax=Halocella sp. SP3-1 TaxID=2382161 RepID=UPI000F752D14|nr:response regulator [Halocella sp. SP3-1]AZO94683.1 response regulator [Halocella sp. SP3-1]